MATALQDLAVLECGTRATVGMCGKLLADLGAQVTKIEPPGGDPSRHEGPFPGDLPHLEQSGLFVYLNRGKRSVTLDLDTVAGRAAVRRLAAEYDVLIVSGTREEIERWGLNYDSLADVSPELICTAITPFGLTGPHRDYADSEIVVAALSGVGHYIPGPAESASDPPVAPPTHLTDFIAATQAATATMVAVTGGGGRQVDVSGQESFLDTLRMYLSTYAYEGAVQPRVVENQVAWLQQPTGRCADGYVSSLPGPNSSDRAWLSIVDVMGNPDWALDAQMMELEHRRAHAEEIIARIDAWTATMSKDDVAEMLQARHIPCLPVNAIDDLLVDEQLIARNFLKTLDHPGLEQALVPSNPIRFDGEPVSVEGRAPFLGEHSSEVLLGVGYTAAELLWLTRSGVV